VDIWCTGSIDYTAGSAKVRASDFGGTVMGALILSCDGIVASFMFVYS